VPTGEEALWGGEFWSDGYFASTVGKHGDEAKIGRYVQSQGQVYKKIHEDKQLSLF
jgi:REP element-mobilizing transposase RayT